MRAAFLISLWLPLLAWPAVSQQTAPGSATSTSLDYEFFKTRVQPIFMAKRAGNARCISCHAPARRCDCSRSRREARHGATRTRARTSRRSAGRRARQPEEQAAASIRSRKRPAATSITTAASTGDSQNDPEWQTLEAWVLRRAGGVRRSRRRAKSGSSRPTAPATTSTSSIPPPTKSSA